MDELAKVFNIDFEFKEAMGGRADILVITLYSKDEPNPSIVELRCFDFRYISFQTKYTYNKDMDNETYGYCKEGLPLLEIMKIMSNEYLRATKAQTANIASNKTNLFNK